MTWVLLAAGVYNLVWGGFVVLFPEAMFRWIGADVPRYPELWQCIGMIVGVYGIGYAVAARDPLRHWPIVLVGLLGKIFGPIGFFDAVVIRDVFPLSFGFTILTNDLIWWVPFTIILWHAFRHAQGDDTPHRAMSKEEQRALFDRVRTHRGTTVGELSRTEGGVLLVLLRHLGCTFCRAMLADVARHRQNMEAKGVALVLVHQSEPTSADKLFAKYGLGDLPHISDPDKELYRTAALGRGSFGQLFGWKSWVRGAKAVREGHGLGRLEGDGFQMPGAVLVQDGRIVWREAPSSASDSIDFAAVCDNGQCDSNAHSSPPSAAGSGAADGAASRLANASTTGAGT